MRVTRRRPSRSSAWTASSAATRYVILAPPPWRASWIGMVMVSFLSGLRMRLIVGLIRGWKGGPAETGPPLLQLVPHRSAFGLGRWCGRGLLRFGGGRGVGVVLHWLSFRVCLS